MENNLLESAADGIQPQDNPDPSSLGQPSGQPIESMPMPAMPQQAQSNVFAGAEASQIMDGQSPVPTGAAAQTAPQPAQDPDEKMASSIISDLATTEPKRDEKKAEKDIDLDAAFEMAINERSDSLPPGSAAVGEALQGEPFWQELIRKNTEGFQYLVTNARAKFDEDPKLQASVFEQMYGKENVRIKDGVYQFRPAKNRKWRGMDGDFADKAANTWLSTALKSFPIVANIATDAGLLMLSKRPNMATMSAAGAAGGAAEALTEEGMKSGIDAVLGIDPERASFAKEVAWDSGFGAAGPAATSLLLRTGAAMGATRMAGGVAGLAAGAMVAGPVGAAAGFALGAATSKVALRAAEKAGVIGGAKMVLDGVMKSELAGEAIERLAMVRAGMETIAERYFPGAKGLSNTQVERKIIGAVEAENKRLGAIVGAVDQEAIALAEEKQLKSAMPNGMNKIKERLTRGGQFVVDPETGQLQRRAARKVVYREEPVFSVDQFGNRIATNRVERKSFEEPEVRSAVPGFDAAQDTMADLYNKLLSKNIADGGSSLQDVLNDIELLLDPAAKYGKDVANETVTMYRAVRNAFSTDRNDLMASAFDGVDSEGARLFATAYKDFSDNMVAATSVLSLFRDPDKRVMLVDAFTKSDTGRKLDYIDSIKKVLGVTDGQGPQPPEWDMLRGGIFRELLKDSMQVGAKAGQFSPDKMMKFFKDEIAEQVFSKDEIGAMRQTLVQAQRMSQSPDVDLKTLAGWATSFGKVAHLLGDPGEMVAALYRMSNGRREVIDYMNDERFLELAKQNYGTEMHAKFLRALDISKRMAGQMPIIDVETTTKRAIKRYAPLAGPAMSHMVERLSSPQGPQMGEPKY